MLTVHSVLFGRDQRYERLARVHESSLRRNSPSTPLVLHRLDASDRDIERLGKHRHRNNLTQNTRKTRHHQAIVEQAKDGELLCLMDCDTLVVGDLSEAERLEFDIAITSRPRGYRYNSGVVFVRVSPLMREWYRRWLATTLKMLANASIHAQYEPRYGGINQSALGCLLETSDLKPHVAELPCAIWNSITETWADFSAQTKVIHILGRLRGAALAGRIQGSAPVNVFAKLWGDYETYAKGITP